MARFRGEAALSAAGKLLPAINASGARRRDVASAVSLIEQTPDPNALFVRHSRIDAGTTGLPLSNLPKEVRLALEMAAHEESERRALEGELALLEDAWKEAEEIAAIADDLFVSDDTRRRISTLKRD